MLISLYYKNKKQKTPNMTDVNILHEYIFIFPNFTKVIGFKVKNTLNLYTQSPHVHAYGD